MKNIGKIRLFLFISTLLLVIIILYSTATNMYVDKWLKGLSAVCIVLYVLYLWMKFREKK